MTRRTLLWSVAIGLPLAALVYWIASNTYWADTAVPMPLRGDAATNPTYGAQRLVEALGGRAVRDRTFTTPPRNAIVVLSTWNWNLSARRRQELEQWVESGGRLVVDASVVGGPEFVRWSRIGIFERSGREDDEPRDRGPCFRFSETPSTGGARAFERDHWLCDVDLDAHLMTTRAVEWALDQPRLGRHAVRVRVGNGSVTAINAEPFRFRRIFDGDHGWLLVAATEFRRGDEVHFLSEGEYPPLLSLVWENGAPVVVLAFAVLGLALWRGGVRIGPLAPEDPPVRRSLAEQIRGTGRFALLHDSGETLHAAAVRAVDEAAGRRVTAYGSLPPPERVGTLAGLAGVAPGALDAAMHDPRERSPHELRNTVALLETVRRALLRQTRQGRETRHGVR